MAVGLKRTTMLTMDPPCSGSSRSYSDGTQTPNSRCDFERKQGRQSVGESRGLQSFVRWISTTTTIKEYAAEAERIHAQGYTARRLLTAKRIVWFVRRVVGTGSVFSPR
jgi:hypothetical protein